MKIFIVTPLPFPIGMAATNRIICYAKGLLAHGVVCEVITSNSQGTEANGVFDGINYTRINRNENSKAGIIYKAFYRWINDINSFIYCCRCVKRDDVIISYSDFFYFRVLFLILSRFKKNRIYTELCEIPGYDNRLKNRLFRFLVLNLLFPLYDGFIAISSELEKLARKYKSIESEIIKVPILIDKDRIDNDSDTEDFEYRNYPYIFYAGAISEFKDGIVTSVKAFIQAARRLDFPIYFILAGPVSKDLEAIKQLSLENEMTDKIIYVGNITPAQVMKYLKYSSLFISNNPDNIQNRNGFSTKLGEALMSGVAVITTSVGEPQYYLKDGESAYFTDASDFGQLVDKIIQAFANPEERFRIANAGRSIALKYFDCIYQGGLLSRFLLKESNRKYK